MSGDLFDLDVVRDFMLDRNGKCTNHDLVAHFKPYLSDPQYRAVNRLKFKDFVNELASVKLDISGEKVLVLKKKYRDITYAPSKDQLEFKEPRTGGGRPKKARHEKPEDAAGASNLDATSGSLNSTCDSGSSSVNTTRDLSLDVSLSQQQGASAPTECKEGGVSDMISALYEAAAANMEAGADQISADARVTEEPETASQTDTQEHIHDTHNETDLSVQEESVLEETSQLAEESMNQTYNTSEVVSPIREYTPDDERKDIEEARGISAASSDQQIPAEEDENTDVIAGEAVSVKDRAKHLNKMTSDADIRSVTSSFAQSPSGQSDPADEDDTHSTISGEMVSDLYTSSRETSEPPTSVNVGVVVTPHTVLLEQDEKEWMVLSSTADYHPMNKMLLKNKSLAKFKDFISGYTALHWAAKHGKPEVVKLLCATNMVNVNARSHGGYTPLHLAAMHGHEDILELLVNTYGANSNLRDYSGKKPKQYLMHSASSRAHQSIPFRRVGSYSDKIHKSGYFGIQVSPAMRNSWAVSNNASIDSLDVEKPSPSSRSPSRSPSWSPRIRRKGSGAKDSNIMPPPQGMPPKRNKSKKKLKDKENEYYGSGSRSGSESDLSIQGQQGQMNFESVV